MWQQLLNLLFPTKCIICDKHHSQNEVCSNPFEYEVNKETICGNCIINKPRYDQATSVLKYDEHSKKLISRFKYQDQLYILNYFVNLMINLGKKTIKDADIIAPIAMHKYKLLKRGYNQAALLAMRIAKKNNIKYLPELLIKKKNTLAQADLKKDQRVNNIKNTIVINKKYVNLISEKKILIIDDVITTGATIDECSNIIRKYNPSSILVLSLAKSV